MYINDAFNNMVTHTASELNHQKPKYIFMFCSFLDKTNQTKREYLRTWESLNYLRENMCHLSCASRSCPSPKLLWALERLEPPDS